MHSPQPWRSLTVVMLSGPDPLRVFLLRPHHHPDAYTVSRLMSAIGTILIMLQIGPARQAQPTGMIAPATCPSCCRAPTAGIALALITLASL